MKPKKAPLNGKELNEQESLVQPALLKQFSRMPFVALYHMGLYAEKELLEWFTTEYPKYSKTKLDMGKIVFALKNLRKFLFS